MEQEEKLNWREKVKNSQGMSLRHAVIGCSWTGQATYAIHMAHMELDVMMSERLLEMGEIVWNSGKIT